MSAGSAGVRTRVSAPRAEQRASGAPSATIAAPVEEEDAVGGRSFVEQVGGGKHRHGPRGGGAWRGRPERVAARAGRGRSSARRAAGRAGGGGGRGRGRRGGAARRRGRRMGGRGSSPRPSNSDSSPMRASASGRAMPCSPATARRFSRTVSSGSSAGAWKTTPSDLRTPRVRAPCQRLRPKARARVRPSSVERMRRSVDLPPPLGPTSADELASVDRNGRRERLDVRRSDARDPSRKSPAAQPARRCHIVGRPGAAHPAHANSASTGTSSIT